MEISFDRNVLLNQMPNKTRGTIESNKTNFKDQKFLNEVNLPKNQKKRKIRNRCKYGEGW